MTVTHPIRTDLVRPGVTPRIYAMQFDGNTRVVELELTAQGEPWLPPEGAAFALAYRKADGTRGFYNQLADGLPAITIDKNRVRVTLAPQVLTASGMVEAALVITAGEKRMGAFAFEIHVAPDPSGGTTQSDDYFNGGISAANAVLYTEQALTEAQQAQARANIGAAAGSIDLVNPEDTAVIRLSGKETGIDVLGLTVQAGKNFYVPQSEDTVDPHYYVNGAPYSTTQFDRTYNCTGPIPVSENTTYTIGFVPSFMHGTTEEVTVPWVASYHGMFFYRKDGTYINGSTSATFTTPAGCAYIRFNYYVKYNIVLESGSRIDIPGIDKMNESLAIVEGSELPSGLDQLKSVTLRDKLNQSNYCPALYYHYAEDGSAVYVASKFNAEQDLVIKLAKRGPNNIFDFAGFKLAPNEKETVVSNFADYDLWETAYATGSDWHAPFRVTATTNGNGDTPESGNFTGGNHNFVNTGTLDSAATGRTSDIKLFADGREIPASAEGYCTNLVICWTNMIQGSNTAKADGTGREILQENHRAVWNGVQWREDMELIALEDIDLSLWYGLQFQGFTETGLKNLRFYGGTNRALHVAPGAYESGNKTANRVRAYNDSLALEMFFDNTHDMGDGSMNSGNLPALFTSAGKCYCRIVSGSHNIAAGEAYAFSGGYRFMPTAGL